MFSFSLFLFFELTFLSAGKSRLKKIRQKLARKKCI